MVPRKKLSINNGMTQRQIRRRKRINCMIDAILNETKIEAIECPYQCGKSGHPDEINNHRHSCSHQLIDCPFYVVGCRAKLMRKDMPKHNTACKNVHELFQRIEGLESLLLNIKTETLMLWNRVHVMDRMFLKFVKRLAATAVS